MSVLQYLEDRSAGFILRWHARQTLRQETIAEHHFFVVRDVMIIYDAIKHYGIPEKLGLEMPEKAEVLQIAHFHDAAEAISGDVSGAAKRDFPTLRRAVHRVERVIVDSYLFRGLPDEIAHEYRWYARAMAHERCDTLAQQMVKYADKLEAYFFAQTEIKVGNSLMRDVFEQVAIELRALKWPWLVELRKETGLP